MSSRLFFSTSRYFSRVLSKPKPLRPGEETVANYSKQFFPICGIERVGLASSKLGRRELSFITKETVPEALNKAVKERGEKTAQWYFFGNEWRRVSWKEYSEGSESFAKSLRALNVGEGSGVVIQGGNSPEWAVINMGAILSKCIPAPSSTSSSAEANLNMVQCSKAEVLALESTEQLKSYDGIKLENLKCIIVWDRFDKASLFRMKLTAPVYSLEEFLEKGKDLENTRLEDKWKEMKSSDTCSYIFTSGTTGKSKAVELSHDNLLWTAQIAKEILNIDEKDRILSYLPPSHIAPQLLDTWCPLVSGSVVTFAQKDALLGTNLQKNIRDANPTIFFAVPRIWEKMKEGIEERVASMSLSKQLVFKSAQYVGKYKQDGIIHNLFNKNVYQPLKEQLGLGCCSMLISGAAPIDQSTIDFWKSLHVRVFEAYGMSETSGLATFPTDTKRSVGKLLPGIDIKIHRPNHQGEGEICIKGRNISKGYYENPEATKEAFDKDGFLHTGDQGRIEEDGSLFITGRLKELIITQGGKNVSPIPIELRIKEHIGMVSEVIIIGDRRKFLTCLLALRTETNEDGTPSDILIPSVIRKIKSLGGSASTLKEAKDDKKLEAALKKWIQQVNAKSESKEQYIQKHMILSEPLRPGRGLTDNMKLKRSDVLEMFRTEIDFMYKR